MTKKLGNFTKFVSALAVTIAAHYLLIALYPAALHTRTQVIGYPIHANFNINRFFWQMYLPMLFLPVATFFLYESFSPARSTVERRLLIQNGSFEKPLREFFVGATAALWLCLAGVSAVTAFMIGGSLYLGLRHFVKYPGLDFFVAVTGLLALSGYSATTEAVQANGAVIRLPWFPTWASIGLFLLALVYLGWRGRRGRGVLISTDRYAAPAVSAAILTQLLWAYVPGVITQTNEFFHGGEILVSGKLLVEGRFPWRDVLFIHGLLEDPFQSALGYLLYDRSAWGAEVGLGLFLRPLCFLALIPLWRALFKKDLPFFLLLAVFLPLFADPFFGESTRIVRHIPYALTVTSVLVTLTRRDRPSAIAMMIALFSYAILAPESSYLVPCVALVVFLQDYSRRNFQLTVTCFVTGLALCGLWAAFLVHHHSLSAFLDYYRIFAADHRFTGGIPMSRRDTVYKIMAYAPSAAVFAYFWVIARRVRQKKRLSPVHWTMLAATLYLILYYQKFLSRADGHVVHSYAIGLPLYFYLGHLLVRRANRWGQQQGAPAYSASAILLVGMLVANFANLQSALGKLPQKFEVKFPAGAETHRPPYLELDSDTERTVAKLNSFLDEQLGPNEKIFDFTNSPQLYFFLLNRSPSTRYFHVSMAIPLLAQKDVIEELEREKPNLVVYHGRHGLNGWDGVPNSVRHHEVSRYLLRHYSPFAEIEGELFLKRTRPELKAASFQGPECDWGAVPAFWSISGSPGRELMTKNEGQAVWSLDLSSIDRDRDGTLNLNIEGAGEFFLSDSLSGTYDPGLRMRFRTLRAEGQGNYPLKVGSCYQWYHRRGDRLFVRAAGNGRLQSVTISE